MKLASVLQRAAVVILLTGLTGIAAAAVDNPRPMATPSAPAPVAVATVVPDQFIDAQQLRVDSVVGADNPGTVPARQTVTAWQIGTGKWNGQILDGLSLVLVQSVPTDASGVADTAIYVSDYATPAQRDALVAAMSASHPTMFVVRDGAWRIEPAFIRVEQINGNTLVLHLAPIA